MQRIHDKIFTIYDVQYDYINIKWLARHVQLMFKMELLCWMHFDLIKGNVIFLVYTNVRVNLWIVFFFIIYPITCHINVQRYSTHYRTQNTAIFFIVKKNYKNKKKLHVLWKYVLQNFMLKTAHNCLILYSNKQEHCIIAICILNNMSHVNVKWTTRINIKMCAKGERKWISMFLELFMVFVDNCQQFFCYFIKSMVKRA